MPVKLFKLILFFCCALSARAQELNCIVKIKHDAIINTDPKVFSTMEKAIADFMNTRKWTDDEFAANEKIDVNLMFNLTGKSGEDLFFSTLNIQSSRPVYNTTYTSPSVNYIDRDVVFRYSQFGTLQFDERRVGGNEPYAANLTAVLAYYAYIILGLDYDSYSLKGGEDYFKRAQNIVNNAPEDGNSIPGWRAVEGNRNRYWLADQLLNPRFVEVRNFWYALHREGLDQMYSKPEEAKKAMLGGISKLSQVQKENPNSMLIQFFFAAKSDELINIVSELPRQERSPYITMLSQMDVPNIQKYQALSR